MVFLRQITMDENSHFFYFFPFPNPLPGDFSVFRTMGMINNHWHKHWWANVRVTIWKAENETEQEMTTWSLQWHEIQPGGGECGRYSSGKVQRLYSWCWELGTHYTGDRETGNILVGWSHHWNAKSVNNMRRGVSKGVGMGRGLPISGMRLGSGGKETGVFNRPV